MFKISLLFSLFKENFNDYKYISITNYTQNKLVFENFIFQFIDDE